VRTIRIRVATALLLAGLALAPAGALGDRRADAGSAETAAGAAAARICTLHAPAGERSGD